MPGASSEYKTQVLAAIDIVELIGRTVALKRNGRGYLGLCPFHQEKTPSFHVKSDRQFFYCFGCKAHGNAIDFVMKRDRIEFVDALNLLGEQAGIDRPKFRGSAQKPGEKQLLLDMQSAACSYFQKLLAHPQIGEPARKYLAERKIDSASIQRFQIGFALDAWDGLMRSSLGKTFAPETLALGGLAKPKTQDDGRITGHYDTFRNRLMFPIRDEGGRVIAFGGRKMPGSDDPAKYLNSPETLLFSKSRCLFGLDLARQKMVESRTAVVVEGYTDVIVAHQFGASNVVSPLGTALTEQHVTILRRFADRIVLLFDADEAGDTAVDRAVGLFLTQPVEIAIASIPNGLDPDEFLLQNGISDFERILDEAADALSYKWKQLDRQFNASGNDLTAQQKAIAAYLEVLASARGSGPVDAIRWGAALTRVSRLTGIPVDELNKRFRSRNPPRRTPAQPVDVAKTEAASAQPVIEPQGPLTAQDRAEMWILGILLLHPHRWHDVQRSMHVEDFARKAHRELAELYWTHQRDEGEPVFNEFLGAIQEPALAEISVQAVDEVEALADPDGVLAEALAYFDRLRRVNEEQKLVAASRRTSSSDSALDEIALLKHMAESRKRPDMHRA